MSVEQPEIATSVETDLTRLSAIIYVFGINKDIWRLVDEHFTSNETTQTQLKQIQCILDSFGVKERNWSVLEQRFGFNERKSFDQISVEMNVSRARVQQIERVSMGRIRTGISQAVVALSHLDDQVGTLWPTLETSNINHLILALQPTLSDMGWSQLQGRYLRRLLIALRGLVRIGSGLERHLPHLTYIACYLSPQVLKHPKIARIAEERQAQQQDLTYEEITEAVLTAAGIPLHYMDIAIRAEELNRRPHVNTKGIHNVLLSNPHKFAYVDTGMYGLTAWGLSSVDKYVDIIADVMKASTKPLSYGEILREVQTKRSIKTHSFQMTLDLNPRFYRSRKGTYGLRAWLPPREKQTLRTPEALVEDQNSFDRVQRAVAKGYDIAAVVAQDQD